jgi:hypothetical protein
MNWSLHKVRNTLSFLMLVTILAAGCKQDEIKSYSVPKEQPPQMAPSVSPAMPAADTTAPTGTAPLRWKTPASWQEVPAGEMRVGSFKVAGKDGAQADVSVIPFPGLAGGDFSNVNRWRGQVGLPPVSEMEVQKLAQPVVLAGQPAVLYEQNGEPTPGKPTRILAAMQRRGDMTWFFKMTGDSQLVAQEKPVFVDFLKSVEFATATGPMELPPGHPPMADSGLPAGHPDISSMPPMAAPAASANDGNPKWDAPAGWKAVAPGGILAAKFLITGDGNAQAAVNISTSAGDGGGLAANVNRWRKQLGLAELTPGEIVAAAKPVTTTSGQGVFVEMSGQDARTGQPAALVGALVMQPGHAWFYKLMGDAKIVAAQKDAFLQFVQGVTY